MEFFQIVILTNVITIIVIDATLLQVHAFNVSKKTKPRAKLKSKKREYIFMGKLLQIESTHFYVEVQKEEIS